MPMEGISKSRVKLRFRIRHVAVHFCLTSIMRLGKLTAISDHGENRGSVLLLIYVKLLRVMEVF